MVGKRFLKPRSPEMVIRDYATKRALDPAGEWLTPDRSMRIRIKDGDVIDDTAARLDRETEAAKPAPAAPIQTNSKKNPNRAETSSTEAAS